MPYLFVTTADVARLRNVTPRAARLQVARIKEQLQVPTERDLTLEEYCRALRLDCAEVRRALGWPPEAGPVARKE